MIPKVFLNRLDDSRIVAAIAAAERRTSGEIRVFVSARRLGKDAIIHRATRRFEKLGMTATRERNAVLLYFVPRDQQFAVIGDTAIHARCGQAFWDEISRELSEQLARGEFTEAILPAIAKTGELLARHFPASPDDSDELPNQVERD